MMRSILIFIICLSVAVLPGCAGKPTATSGKVVISVGAWPSKEGPELEAREELLKRFNEKYGDTIEIVPDKWEFDLQTFLPKAASGQLPTIFGAYFTEADRIISAGYAADITKYMEKYDYIDKVNDSIKQIIQKDGKTYLIPKSSYAFGIMANLNILREAGLVDKDENPIMPKTYEELANYSKIITEKTGKVGFIMPTTNNNGGWHFTIIAWANGVKFMEKQGDKWFSTFNTPECVEVLQYIKDLKWKSKTLSSNSLINMGEAQKLFATDQGAFYLSSTPSNTLISNYGMSKDDIGMGAIPAGKNKHVTLMGGSFKAIAENATNEQIDAAFKWLEFEGITPHLTEDAKATLENKYKVDNQEKYVVGVPKFTPWNEKSTVTKFEDELCEKYLNVNINHISQYGIFDGIEIHKEEPVCCQDLYSILDSCIQAVLTDENADCAQLISRASRNFQSNYLDNAK